MKKLFIVEPSNHYGMPCLCDFEENHSLLSGWGFRFLKEDWRPLQYEFEVEEAGKKKNKIPDICKSNTIAVLFRADLIDKIFPAKPDKIELLPINVGSESWVLVNCLKTTSGYDATRSKFWRGGEGNQILFTERLVVEDLSVEESGLFTLEDSNRASLFATEDFKERIDGFGLKGLSFREIGFLGS